ncbi:MAG: hypothetical protein ACREJC_17905 [Tepidisphaeraceae bacterium]
MRSYYAGDYDDAARRLAPLADKTNENFVLNNLRLGSTELMRSDLTSAENAFVRAYEVINSYGVNNGGRSLGAVLVDEKIKIFKGEPYERAMADFYLGLVYYMRHDYANARGAFESALFKLRDYGDTKEKKADDYREIESNFAIAAIMLGKCWQHLGREDLARANFERAQQIRPDLKYLADYELNLESNLLLIVEYGQAPRKVTDFDGSMVGFSPTPVQAGPIPLPRVFVDGRDMDATGVARPAVDLVAMASDRVWQSIDTIRLIKSAVGTGLLMAGTYEGFRGLNESGSAQQRDLTAAAILLGTGLLLKATSQADVRQWEMLPRAVFVIPLYVPPGSHDVVVDFPGIPGLRQEIRNLQVAEGAETTYLLRMSLITHTPRTPLPAGDDEHVVVSP